MKLTIYKRKVDPQRRIRLPRGYDYDSVFIIREDDGLKILPQRNVALTDFFDKAKPSKFSPDPFEDYAGHLSAKGKRLKK